MFSPPAIDRPITDQISRLENAILVPPPKGDKNRGVTESGVFDALGNYIERGVTFRGPRALNKIPEIPPEKKIRTLPGRHLYAGLLFGHFGHFLVESICRLWAMDLLEGEFESLVYIPKFQQKAGKLVRDSRQMLKGLGIDVPITLAHHPTRVETLYVPQQGFGMYDMIDGAPEFRKFVNTYNGEDVKPSGAEKIYLSRSKLPPARGGLLAEKRLEAHLKDEGYEIFHPQKHSFRQQVAAYKAARKIISVDGSPLHLIALVGNSEQKVACIARRQGDFDQVFARQLEVFKSIETSLIDALIENWIPARMIRINRLSFGELDFGALYDGLKAEGFIGGLGARWPTLDDDARSELLEEIENYQGEPFKAFSSVDLGDARA